MFPTNRSNLADKTDYLYFKNCHNLFNIYESTKLRASRAHVLTYLACSLYLHAFVITCQRVLRSYVLTCQRVLPAYVLTCQRVLRAHVPTYLMSSSGSVHLRVPAL